LTGLLRSVHEYVRRIVRAEALEGGLTIDPATQMPSGITGRIVLREPSSALKKTGIMTIDELFEILNKALEENELKVWVLLDRLDVAFVDNHLLEANALRALIRAYADVRHRDEISLKIFLREDIWKRITEHGLREASHLIRYVILDWTQPALLNLIMRRLLNNSILTEEFGIDGGAVLKVAEQQEELFYKFFPNQVEQGPQKAPTFKWLVTRCADGTGKTAPRELIHLLNCILEQEIKRLEQGASPAHGDQLFDRSVFKLALPTVSSARLNQFLYAEYAGERPFVSKLDGQKAEQTLDSLSDLWSMDRTKPWQRLKSLSNLVSLNSAVPGISQRFGFHFSIVMRYISSRVGQKRTISSQISPCFQYINNIAHFPKLLRHSRRHCRRHFQRLMNAHEIVVHKIDRHHVRVVFGLL
jgi:hypothetical protein